MRRLPVYLCVDTSESMISCQQALSDGVARLLVELRKNPYALETVWLSVITFDSTARVLVPLTDICEFHAPDFELQAGTAMGAAIDLLRERIAREVVRTTDGVKGDWRPIVFFLTDGAPTDEWREPLLRFQKVRPRPANVYAIGCGDDVDYEVLKLLAKETFQFEGKTDEEISATLQKIFVWLSASIGMASREGDDALGDVDRTPPGARRFGDDDVAPQRLKYPRRLFLHAMCSYKSKKFLVCMRFNDEKGRYDKGVAYKVKDSFSFENDGKTSEIPSSLLFFTAYPKCPYCGEHVMLCPKCGIHFCYTTFLSLPVFCPVCHTMFASWGSGGGGGWLSSLG